MEKITIAQQSAAFLVRDLQALYADNNGLVSILAMDLLKSAVEIRAKLELMSKATA